LNKALKNKLKFYAIHRNPTGCCGLLGCEEEADDAAKEVLKIDPKFSIERHVSGYGGRIEADKKRFFDVLRNSGL
jgi:hypothetical protein